MEYLIVETSLVDMCVVIRERDVTFLMKHFLDELAVDDDVGNPFLPQLIGKRKRKFYRRNGLIRKLRAGTKSLSLLRNASFRAAVIVRAPVGLSRMVGRLVYFVSPNPKKKNE